MIERHVLKDRSFEYKLPPSLRILPTSLVQKCNLLAFLKDTYINTRTFKKNYLLFWRKGEREGKKEVEKQGNENVNLWKSNKTERNL